MFSSYKKWSNKYSATGLKGFTLLELLIVISIIAILSVALILVLNPAEALKKSRDTNRISDVNTIKTALGIYLTSTTTPWLGGATADTSCGTIKSSTTTLVTLVDGTGWIPVNLLSLTGGAPISNLPNDPLNTGIYGYWYKCNSANKTFEVSAVLESSAYGPGGADDKSAKDGGNESGRYEVGTDLTL